MQKLLFGISILLLGFFAIFNSLKTFNPEPVRAEGFVKTDVIKGKEPQRIIIPEVGIDIPVKYSKIIGGYWQVFEDVAGWGEGSGYPGESGNQVIFAHARVGLFLPLRNVKSDTKIYVMQENNWYTYKVTEIKEVYPNQIEVVKPTIDETLTLYTCSGYQDSKRLIVVAKRI